MDQSQLTMYTLGNLFIHDNKPKPISELMKITNRNKNFYDTYKIIMLASILDSRKTENILRIWVPVGELLTKRKKDLRDNLINFVKEFIKENNQ